MPKFQVTTAEKWGMRVTYEFVEAETIEEAVELCKGGEVSVEMHEVIWEDNQDFDELLMVEDEDGERVFDINADADAAFLAGRIVENADDDAEDD